MAREGTPASSVVAFIRQLRKNPHSSTSFIRTTPSDLAGIRPITADAAAQLLPRPWRAYEGYRLGDCGRSHRVFSWTFDQRAESARPRGSEGSKLGPGSADASSWRSDCRSRGRSHETGRVHGPIEVSIELRHPSALASHR